MRRRARRPVVFDAMAGETAEIQRIFFDAEVPYWNAWGDEPQERLMPLLARAWYSASGSPARVCVLERALHGEGQQCWSEEPW